MSLAHTCTHDVVSEEWGSEPKGQHEQVAGEARKQLFKTCRISAEIGKGSRHQHAMGMEAQDVVVPGVQVSCLHQLWEERNVVKKGASVSVHFFICICIHNHVGPSCQIFYF